MPIYIFLDDRDNSVHEVIQTMKEEHIAFAKDGYKLQRIFSLPQTSISSISKIDPFDSKAFVNVTGTKKGNYGDLQDLSKELSEKREKTLGKDPLLEKTNENYKKNHRGMDLPEIRKKKLKEKLKKTRFEWSD